MRQRIHLYAFPSIQSMSLKDLLFALIIEFTGLQMFTSDEKSYEEKDEVVVHSISVKIFELSRTKVKP
ncbi:unnamed protein product [Camellia sinensis]